MSGNGLEGRRDENGETPATAILQDYLGSQLWESADIIVTMGPADQSAPVHKQSPRAFGLARDHRVLFNRVSTRHLRRAIGMKRDFTI